MASEKLEELKLRMIGEIYGRLEVLGYEVTENNAYKTYFYCHCACGNFCKIWGGSLRMGKTVSCGCYRAERAGNKKEMIGCKFGKLTVIEYIGNDKNRQTMYKCLCDCGSYSEVRGTALRKTNDSTKSCGCLTREQNEIKPGTRFGRLEVVKLIESKRNYLNYLCKCDCGNTTEVISSNLRKGTQSCGCLATEKAKERFIEFLKQNRGENHYRYDGTITDVERNEMNRRKFKCSGLRELSFKRDSYKCEKCGKGGGRLNAHHVQNWKNYPDLRFEISNLCTLCVTHHKEFHSKYGTKFNTKEQMEEYLGKPWNPPEVCLIKIVDGEFDRYCLANDPIYLGM